MDLTDTRRLWLGGRQMWRTPNRGQQWFAASPLLPALVSAVAVHPTDGNIVLAGTAAGHIVRTSSATTATVATQWQTTQPRQGFVSWIAFDPTEPNTVYATYAGFGGTHIWMSNDGGVTWAPRDSTLPDIPVHSLAVDPTRPFPLISNLSLSLAVTLGRIADGPFMDDSRVLHAASATRCWVSVPRPGRYWITSSASRMSVRAPSTSATRTGPCPRG